MPATVITNNPTLEYPSVLLLQRTVLGASVSDVMQLLQDAESKPRKSGAARRSRCAIAAKEARTVECIRLLLEGLPPGLSLKDLVEEKQQGAFIRESQNSLQILRAHMMQARVVTPGEQLVMDAKAVKICVRQLENILQMRARMIVRVRNVKPWLVALCKSSPDAPLPQHVQFRLEFLSNEDWGGSDSHPDGDDLPNPDAVSFVDDGCHDKTCAPRTWAATYQRIKVLHCTSASIFQQVLAGALECQFKDFAYSTLDKWLACPSCVRDDDEARPCSHTCALAIQDRQQHFVATKISLLEYPVKQSINVDDHIRKQLHAVGWAIVDRI